MKSESRSVIEAAMDNWRIVFTLTAILIVLGLYAFFTMQRQEFPSFTIRQGLVLGVMPGAPTEEVEERLARPVEEYLFGFEEIKKAKTYSVSREGMLVVYVELKDEITGLEAPVFWNELRHGLSELKAQRLPAQVLALLGNNDFGDTSALLFTLTAEGKSPRDLRECIRILEDHLRMIEATTKLRVYGMQDEVIRVTISPDRIANYGIRPATVWASLQGFGTMPAPARLDDDQLERPIHVRRVLQSENELAETIILSLPTGQHVRLRDVADIRREYGHDDSYVRYNRQTALVLSIEMQPGNDITHFGDQVDLALEETIRELPPGVTIARVADQPEVVRRSVNHFLRDFGLAIVSVILVTILLLPTRVASVAAITIPITIAITLAVLNALGIKLQTVSLAGLVVVLGMVVDNAIVIVDDHVDKLDQGMDPWQAAWKSAKELAVPVFAATIAIILSYVPLPVFVSGVAGEFLESLPATIGFALLTSMLVALLLLPTLNAWLIRTGLHREGSSHRSILDRLQTVFDTSLEAAFRHPWVTVFVGIASVVGAGVLATHIPQQSFPKMDRNQFAVEVYLPNGRSLEQTDEVVRRLEQELLADERVVNVTSFIGQSSPRFHTLYAPHMPARNYAQLLVNTASDEATEAVLHENEARLTGTFPEAWVRWKQLEFQIGFPVEVRFSGRDHQELKRVAAEFETQARDIPGVIWIHNDWEEAMQSIEVTPDADACARLGIPPAMIQTSLALGTQGYPVTTIWEGDYPVSVVVEDTEEERSSVEELRQQYVPSMLGGVAVPLDQIATVEPAWHEGAVVHRNGVPTLTVFLDVRKGVLGSVVQQQVDTITANLEMPGIRVSYGGERELSEEVMGPMTISMMVSFGAVFLVLLFQFKRFRKALVVMSSMLLGLIGAFVGLVIADYPFGVTAFAGIIGLMGISVRNGIILVTYAEDLQRNEGLTAMEAALAAGKRRMRPIYLTAMAAAVGVVPLILSRSTLWGPLGTVTCFGLLAAMVLTLFVLPVVYGLAMRGENSKTSRPVKTAVLTGCLLLICCAAPVYAQDDPLTLAACRKLALQRNAQILQSKLAVESARETRAAAFTNYFPHVSATMVGVTALHPLAEIETSGGNLPVYDGNPANLASATQFAYMPGGTMAMGKNTVAGVLTAMQPLYAGGRIVNGNRLAEVGVNVALDRSVVTQRDVLVRTEEKYWRLVALGEQLNTLEAYENLLAALDNQVTDALTAGVLTRNDQLKVRLKRAEVGVKRQRLQNGLALSVRDLCHHVGLSEADTVALGDTLALPVDPVSLISLREGAVDRRPEMRLLQHAVRANRLQTSMKRGESLPTVSVGVSQLGYDVTGLHSHSNTLAFGMVSIPLSGIWEGRHATASQCRQTEIAESELAHMREMMQLQIENTWRDLTVAWQACQVAEQAVEQAEVNVREVSDHYENGIVPFSDLLEAQALRQEAFGHRIDARADYWVKRSKYLQAVAAESLTQ